MTQMIRMLNVGAISALDFGFNSNDGQTYTGTSIVRSPYGNARQFDGIDDNVATYVNTQSTSVYILAYINSSQSSTYCLFDGRTDNSDAYIDESGHGSAITNLKYNVTNAFDSVSELPRDEWILVSFTASIIGNVTFMSKYDGTSALAGKLKYSIMFNRELSEIEQTDILNNATFEYASKIFGSYNASGDPVSELTEDDIALISNNSKSDALQELGLTQIQIDDFNHYYYTILQEYDGEVLPEVLYKQILSSINDDRYVVDELNNTSSAEIVGANCLSFDGSSEYVPIAFDIDNDYVEIKLIVLASDLTKYAVQHYSSPDGRIYIQISENGALRTRFGDNQYQSADGAIQVGVPYTIRLSWANGMTTTSLDGVVLDADRAYTWDGTVGSLKVGATTGTAPVMHVERCSTSKATFVFSNRSTGSADGQTAWDVSGNGNHGTITGGTWTQDDDLESHNHKYGHTPAVVVDSTTDRFDLYDTDLTSLLSDGVWDIELDMEFSTDTSKYGRILWFYNDTDSYFFRLQRTTGTDTVSLWARKGAGLDIVNKTFAVPLGERVKIGLVSDGTTSSIYVDGELVARAAVNRANLFDPVYEHKKIFMSNLSQLGLLYSAKIGGSFQEVDAVPINGGSLYNKITGAVYTKDGTGTLVTDYIPALTEKTKSVATFDGITDSITVPGLSATDVVTVQSFEEDAVLGEELVTNGDFSDGSTGWEVFGESTTDTGAGRVYSSDGSLSYIRWSDDVYLGNTYLVGYDVAISDGSVLANNFSSFFWTTQTTGTKNNVYTATQNFITFKRTTPCDVTLDNVSVRELLSDHAFPSAASGKINWTSGNAYGWVYINGEPVYNLSEITGKATSILTSYSPNWQDGEIVTGAGGLDTFWGTRIADDDGEVVDAEFYLPVTNPGGNIHNKSEVKIKQTDEDMKKYKFWSSDGVSFDAKSYSDLINTRDTNISVVTDEDDDIIKIGTRV